ncbi:hypothetical protein TNCV_344481 [Trichonephila clavipes]|nr:hypothetical protein TNCV_344481 [Trichonephila clavipes]
MEPSATRLYCRRRAPISSDRGDRSIRPDLNGYQSRTPCCRSATSKSIGLSLSKINRVRWIVRYSCCKLSQLHSAAMRSCGCMSSLTRKRNHSLPICVRQHWSGCTAMYLL